MGFSRLLPSLNSTIRRPKHATIQLRKRHRLKLADAIIAGTAFSLGADLVSNDRRLANITEISIRTVRRTGQ